MADPIVNPAPVAEEIEPTKIDDDTQSGTRVYFKTENCWTYEARYMKDNDRLFLEGKETRRVFLIATHMTTRHYQATIASVPMWNQLVEDRPMIPAIFTHGAVSVRELDSRCDGRPHTCTEARPVDPSEAPTAG